MAVSKAASSSTGSSGSLINTRARNIYNGEFRRSAVQNEEIVHFSSLPLNEPVLNGLKDSGYKVLFPIQAKAFPHTLNGKSVMLQANSRAGKTLAFVINTLQLVSWGHCDHIQILILVPTRETAVKIADILRNVGRHIKDLSVGLFVGGQNVDDDLSACWNCQIAIGIPGRIMQLIRSEELPTEGIELVILDEVDQLVNGNCNVFEIICMIPSWNQLIMATGTYTDVVTQTFRKMCPHLKIIHDIQTPRMDSMLLSVHQWIFLSRDVPYHNAEMKRSAVLDILKEFPFKQVKSYSNMLNQMGYLSGALSNAESQNARVDVLQKFMKKKFNILVATDLATCSIDVMDVDLIISVGIPNPIVNYVHRMGLIGRFGLLGRMVSIITDGEELRSFVNGMNSVLKKPARWSVMHSPRDTRCNEERGGIVIYPDHTNFSCHVKQKPSMPSKGESVSNPKRSWSARYEGNHPDTSDESDGPEGTSTKVVETSGNGKKKVTRPTMEENSILIGMGNISLRTNKRPATSSALVLAATPQKGKASHVVPVVRRASGVPLMHPKKKFLRQALVSHEESRIGEDSNPVTLGSCSATHQMCANPEMPAAAWDEEMDTSLCKEAKSTGENPSNCVNNEASSDDVQMSDPSI